MIVATLHPRRQSVVSHETIISSAVKLALPTIKCSLIWKSDWNLAETNSFVASKWRIDITFKNDIKVQPKTPKSIFLKSQLIERLIRRKLKLKKTSQSNHPTQSEQKWLRKESLIKRNQCLEQWKTSWGDSLGRVSKSSFVLASNKCIAWIRIDTWTKFTNVKKKWKKKNRVCTSDKVGGRHLSKFRLIFDH